ncbi:MAG: lipid II flippase MurJ [Leisingera sp.]
MKQNGTLRNIISVTLWKSVGMGLSLVIALAIANLFGAGPASDAFFLARRVVSNIAAAVERTFQFLQVPPLVRMAETQGLEVLARHLRKRSWQILLAAAVLCAAAFVFAPAITRLLAPGFSAEQHGSATVYLRVLLAVLPLSAATALSGAVLNALRMFRLPVIARLLPRACAAVTLALVPVFAFGLGAVALAIAAGTVVMAVFFGICIRRALAQDWQAQNWQPDPDRKNSSSQLPYSRSRVWAMLLAQFHLFGAGWIDMAMASLTGAGSVATLEFAQRMTNMAPGVVTSSVIIVYYTEFASHLARGRQEAFRKSMQDAMRATLLFVMPAAVVLFMLNRPAVSVLLGHGAFEPWAVQQTASIIALLAPLLVVNALVGTLASALFADPGVPHLKIVATSIAAALAVRLSLNWLLLPVYGVLAVPFASLCAITVMLLIFYLRLVQAFGAPVRLREAGPFAAMAVAAAAAAAVIWLLQAAMAREMAGRLEMLSVAAVSALGGALAFAAVAAVLKVPEMERVRSALRKAAGRGTA